MFYPVESLKRGGRFHLCWVADSWPLRFAAITHRQLWSQDIRKLCDDLLEVITNESGRPTNRFSLRLSSQLLRGLVRLYERKVTVLLGDLCMINATVFKHTNKRYIEHERHKKSPKRLPQLQPAAAVVPEEPENEPRVEELIRNSGNVVSNIQDITLKEAAIPEFQLPPNDNFGEENPEQALQSLLAERTLELMRQDTSAAHVSALELPNTPTPGDTTRLAIDAPHMESFAELDITMLRKSAGDLLMPEFEKDIPDIPELPAPMPIPTEPVPPEPQELELHEKEKEMSSEMEVPEVPAPEVPDVPVEPPRAPEPVDVELEELEDQPLGKRRRRSKLIIDKRIRLGTDFLRARIDNPNVDMRFEDFSDAIIEIRVPSGTLLHEPAHTGCRLFSRMAGPLLLMYQRRLEHMPLHRERLLESESESEQGRQQRGTRSVRSPLPRIPEEEQELVQAEQSALPPAQEALDTTARATSQRQPTDMHTTAGELVVSVDPINITTEPLSVPGAQMASVPQDVNVPMQVDIADLPTQKLETLSQIAKRKSGQQGEDESPPKRVRSGYMSFRESQQQRTSQEPPEIIFNEPDKENIPPNIQEVPAEQPSARRQSQQLDHSQVASRLLQEAGLADVQQYPRLEPQGEVPVAQPQPPHTQARKPPSDGSDETPLGSLDRTKVSLGDSVKTTDSQRFIRKQWGIEGTMMKIMVSVKAGRVTTVQSLLAHGPLIPGCQRIIAARCFTSILKLKQHGFVRVERDPNTLEIQDIVLGPRFDDM